MSAPTPDPEARNRHVAPDPAWILPLTPPPGVGIVTPSCTDRTDVLAVPIRTGRGLRIGGEASLCWRCGPGGSVYHPDAGYSMADVRRVADRLPFVTGYDPADLTPAVLAEFERALRAALERTAPAPMQTPFPEAIRVQVLAVDPPRGTLAVLHAVTPDGRPCRVACDPGYAADLAERLAAESRSPEPRRVYASVQSWQLLMSQRRVAKSPHIG
jgi:hypothetical protein